MIASGCPASEVCDQLKLGEVEGSRRVKDLAERHLITISEPAGNFASVARATKRPDAELAGPGAAGSNDVSNGSDGASIGGATNGSGNGTSLASDSLPPISSESLSALAADTDLLAGSEGDLLTGSGVGTGSSYTVLGSDDSSADRLGTSEALGWGTDASFLDGPAQSEITAPGDFGSGPALGSLLGGQDESRPAMPPAPSSDDLQRTLEVESDGPAGLIPPEYSSIDETSELEDPEEQMEQGEASTQKNGGGLLARYLNSDD